MSLLKYISLIGPTKKNDLLTPDVTKLLRQTFCDDEFGVLPKTILDLALYSSYGHELVQKRLHREYIIDSLPHDVVNRLGYDSYTEAKGELGPSPEKFVEKLEIEPRFLNQKPPETRQAVTKVNPKFGSTLKSRGFLHPYQKRIKDELLRSFWGEPAINARLCLMPTGAGKTTVALELCSDLMRSKSVQTARINKSPFKFLWLVEGDHLAEQSLQAMTEIWSLRGDQPSNFNRFFSPFNDASQSFKTQENQHLGVFCTFSLVTNRLDDENLRNYLSDIDLLIVDEAHSSKAETYLSVIKTFQRLNSKGSLLGLTATPYRSDDSAQGKLKDLFQRHWTVTDSDSQPLKSPIDWLIKKGYLSRLNVHQINDERSSIGEFAYYQKLHDAVFDVCQNVVARQENLIIFAESKAHAISLSLFLGQKEISNEVIIGETPNQERQQILSKLKNAKESGTHVVVNHQILSKGLDVPGLNSIMILGRPSNPALALQIIGRAMRGKINGGNESNTLYLTRDNFQFLRNTSTLESIIQQA